MNRRLYFIPLLLCCLFATPLVAQEAPALSQKEIQGLIDVALKDFDAKAYAKALENLKKAEKADPNSPFIMNVIGATYTKMADYGNAKVAYEKAISLQPDFFPAAYNMAELLFLEKKYAEAYDAFTTLLARNPERELLQFKVFLCLLFLDRKDGAQRLLKQMRLPGEDPAAYYAKAAWEYDHGNKPKFAEYVKTARILFPDKTTIYDETFRDLGWSK